MTLLSQAGFDLYADDAVHLASRALSPALSPLHEQDDVVDDEEYIVAEEEHLDQQEDDERAQEEGLSQAFSTTALSSQSEVDNSPQAFPSPSPPSTAATQTALPPSSPSALGAAASTRSKSHSPTPGEVSVLAPELACVGLVDDSVENWSLKIVKLVAFPELVPRPAHLRPHVRQPQEVPRRMSTTDSGLFSPIFEPTYRGRENDERSYKRKRRRQASFLHSSSSSSSHASSCDFDDDEDTDEDGSNGTCSSRSESRLSMSMSATSLPTSPSEPTPASPLTELCQCKSDAHLSPPPQTSSRGTRAIVVEPERRERKRRHPATITIQIPFFSFTRTPEGSSLTTDVDILAALFAPHERHMVICGDELDEVDQRWAREQAEAVLSSTIVGGVSGEEERLLVDDGTEDAVPLDEIDETLEGEDVVDAGEAVDCNMEDDEEENVSTTLKCLQIDLRRFGLGMCLNPVHNFLIHIVRHFLIFPS
jgi:hypothetical protein